MKTQMGVLTTAVLLICPFGDLRASIAAEMAPPVIELKLDTSQLTHFMLGSAEQSPSMCESDKKKPCENLTPMHPASDEKTPSPITTGETIAAGRISGEAVAPRETDR